MEVLLKAALGVVLVSLVLQPGPMLAQKGKPAPQPKETQLAALFRDNWDVAAQKYGDKIHSDGGGPYYTVREPDRTYSSIVQLGSDGGLNMQVLRNRKVFFEFDTPVRTAPLDSNGQLTCRDWGGDTVFHVNPPSFLAGVPDNDYFNFYTFGKITYNGTEWVYDPSTMFDFRAMPVDANASSLVRMQTNFSTAADVGLFGVMPNYQGWSADAPLAGGVVKVTHPFADVWVVEPQSAPQLPGDPPLRGLELNEAGFKYGVPEVKRVRPGGNCDLGDWVMPFRLTLTKAGGE